MSEIIKNNLILTEKQRIMGKYLLILLNILINSVILFIAFLIIDYTFQKWLLPFAVLSVTQLLLNIITIKKLEGMFFSLTTLFLIFSFITHLGIVVIFGFNIQIDLPWNPLLTISENVFRDACYFSLCSHFFLTLGMAIVLSKKKSHKTLLLEPDDNKGLRNQLYYTKNIGMILFLIGIIPMLYIDISKINLFLNGNYLDTFQVGAPGFVYIIASFTDVGIMMLLLGNKDNKKKATLIFGIVIIYKGILMFTGGRGEPILFLLSLFFIYFRFIRIKKIKPKQFIFNLILVYICGFVLTFISQIRMMSINNIETMMQLMKKSFIDFSPFSVIAEFGGTIITLGISMDFFSSTGDFQYGSNYLVSLLNIFPNLGGVLDFTIPKTIYVNNFPPFLRTFLGGSYLGEIYYSFGILAPFFVTIIGMVVGYVSLKIQDLFNQNRFILMSILLILFPNLLWWTRAYFVDMIREFVWTSVFIMIFFMLFENKYKLKTKIEMNPLKKLNI
ncbi:O-antigen polysaccharide polymerase Wzy [Lysinibacillus contaminans]|uniref:O-antigen polysaccharide polymerase Wzy n=1 Tax=Lysinibacillus contaminans TaxID=1293441 RepID=UPI0006ADCBF6|nr:O-antigen polysaccharide polymerase Wzy [Lysinibacillus contaminans]